MTVANFSLAATAGPLLGTTLPPNHMMHAHVDSLARVEPQHSYLIAGYDKYGYNKEGYDKYGRYSAHTTSQGRWHSDSLCMQCPC
jgi:hypothetical protein